MESFNTSVSPQSGGRQSHFGHEDRDEIKRRAEADFLELYMDHGGRRRGKGLHCPFHEDRTPSASIHKGRFHCFTCNISLDAIEFVQKAQATTFKNALAYLSDCYGVTLHPWRLPPAERARYAHRQRDLERDLPAARQWRRAALVLTESVLANLKAASFDSAEGPAEPDEILRFEGMLVRLRRLHGAALVDEYRRWAGTDGTLTAALVHAAQTCEAAEVRALEKYLALAEVTA